MEGELDKIVKLIILSRLAYGKEVSGMDLGDRKEILPPSLVEALITSILECPTCERCFTQYMSLLARQVFLMLKTFYILPPLYIAQPSTSLAARLTHLSPENIGTARTYQTFTYILRMLHIDPKHISGLFPIEYLVDSSTNKILLVYKNEPNKRTVNVFSQDQNFPNVIYTAYSLTTTSAHPN